MAEEKPKEEQKPTRQTVDDGLQKPGDVIVNQLLLNTVSSDVALDLKPYMMEFHLYEDIFSPTLQGSVVIRDAVNLIGRLPIIGDEILTVDIQTPWGDAGGYNKSNLGSYDPLNKIQKSFSVYAVKDRKLNNDREQYYQLFFCSIEASTDNIIRLSQKFEGTTDEIISKIFEENISTPRLFTNKQVIENVDEKTELFIADIPHESTITFVPAMWSPIQCINWLAKRCIGATYKSPNFLFFETTKAFYLSSVEELVAYQLENNQIYSDYVYHPNLSELPKVSALNKGFATVEAIKFLTNLDVIQGQDLGHFASTVHSFDLVKKKYTSYSYDHGFNFNGTDEQPTKHMESYKFVANSDGSGSYQYDDTKKFNMIYPINVLRSADNKPFIATVNPGVLDSTEDSIDLHPEKFVAQRNSSLLDLTTMRLQLTVPGRTDIEVGRLIRFFYPSVGEKNVKDDSEAFVWDILISGIYMVTAIHHQITPLRHTMYMEIAKDSYAEPLYEVEMSEESGNTNPTNNAPANDATTPATDQQPTNTNTTKPVGKGGFIGDSIAVGLGSQSKGGVTNATVGWNTEKIKQNYSGKGGSDYTVISMGTNDKGYPNAKTADNATAVRESIKAQTKKVVWILPYDRDLAQKIQGVASKYGDKVVDLKNYPTKDGLHPTNYGKVLERVNQLIAS